jgi:hypothetical protein
VRKGHPVVATVKGGARFSGILATAPADNGELSVALQLARPLDPPPGASQEPKKALLILAKDLVELSADDVDVDRRFPHPSTAEAWKTDADISGSASPSANRPLQRWEAAPDISSVAGGLEDNAKPSSRVWDQFLVNERLFGTKSDYEEELYTTKIDRTAKDFKEREKRAMQIAQEILSVCIAILFIYFYLPPGACQLRRTNRTKGAPVSAHVAEERNQKFEGSTLDEEDKSVICCLLRLQVAY